jgi:hypothetical protein
VRRNWPLAAALLLFVAGLSLLPMAESDLFFRIKAGQEILARHALAGRNLFSFTYPDYPDIDTAWLFEVGAAALFARGGFTAIVIAKTVVLMGAFGGALWLCLRRSIAPLAAALALAAAAFVGRERFVERPHIFSLAGEIAVLAAADAIARAGDDGRRAARAALALLAAVVVWANLHAGVFVAPLLLGLAAAGGGGSRATRRLALVALAAAAATLATPVGVGLYRYLRLHTIILPLHPVDEFRAPTWVSDAPLIIYATAVVAAALAVRPRLLRLLLPPLALGLLAARSVRFGADFALCAAPLLATGLAAAGRALTLRAPALGRARLAPVAVALFTLFLAGAAVVPRLAAARAGRPAIDVGLDESALPLDAIRFVDREGLRDRMYNDFEIGSYLAFDPVAGYPRHQVFVDPRLPAYPPEIHRLLGRADLSRADWSAAMRRYGVDSALIAYAGLNRRAAWWDPDEWALVYRAHDARVFVRRAPRFRALIAAREIPATFSFTVEEGAATVPLDAPPAGSPVADCEWQRRLGDLLFELDGGVSARARAAYRSALDAADGCLAAADDARLASWMGAVELGEGHAAAALVLFDRALAVGGGDLATRTNRAVALEGLGHAADAADAWGDVAARAAGSPLAAKAAARRAALRVGGSVEQHEGR